MYPWHLCSSIVNPGYDDVEMCYVSDDVRSGVHVIDVNQGYWNMFGTHEKKGDEENQYNECAGICMDAAGKIILSHI